MPDPHCRIGQIRAKSGAVVHVLPGLAERNAKEAFTALCGKYARVRELYGGDLDGFVLITWSRTGDWSCWYRDGDVRHGNTLPEFARGAVQRQIAMDDASKLLEDTLQNR
jgi:hypothetical protein